MPLFVLVGMDGPNGPEIRGQHRTAHLAHIDGLDAEGRISYAGPIRDDGNEKSIGAVIVFEASDLATAREVAHQDPFVSEGVFESLSIQPFKKVYPK